MENVLSLNSNVGHSINLKKLGLVGLSIACLIWALHFRLNVLNQENLDLANVGLSNDLYENPNAASFLPVNQPEEITNNECTMIVAASNASNKTGANYVCTGKDDQNKINEALTKCKRVILTDGDFYISRPIKTTYRNNILSGASKDRTRIRTQSSFSGSQMIYFTGKANEEEKAEGGVPIQMGKLNKGATTISLSGASSFLSVGEYFSLTSAPFPNEKAHPKDVFDGTRPYYFEGEWCQVKSVSSSQVTLVQPLRFTYDDNTKLYHYNLLTEVGVENMTVYPPGNLYIYAIEIDKARGAFVKGVKVVDQGSKKTEMGIVFDRVVEGEISGCHVEGVLDINASSRTGYGYYLHGCDLTKIVNCTGKNNKHTVDVAGTNWAPVSTRIRVENVSADVDEEGSFSTHSGTYDIYWYKCRATNTPSWGVIRNPKTKIEEATYYSNLKSAFPKFLQIGELRSGGTWDSYDGRGGEDLEIINCKVDILNNNNTEVSYIFADDPLVNVSIRGGQWKGARAAMRLYGLRCENVRVENVFWQFNTGGKNMILIDPREDGKRGHWHSRLILSFKTLRFVTPLAPLP
ncbi:MAG: hypothetical protein HC880_12550, partial [Bacteroidia bacterium]|nr:hypothetical protein [Bacteroidia bacterium]